MRGGLTRHFALIPGITIAVLSCQPDRATGPEGDASMARTLGSVTGLSVAATSASRIAIAWQDNSNNERGFEIHRSTTGAAGVFSLHMSVGANVTNHADEGLSAKTEYCYKVRPFRVTGPKTVHGDFSSTECATTLGPPSTPSSVTAKPASSSAIDITWSDVSNDESGFRLERASAPNGSWTAVISSSAGVTAHRDEGRTAEQSVCYRVIAFNTHGESVPSAADCTAPPARPTNLVATADDDLSIRVEWTDASSLEDGYELQRARSDFVWTTVALLGADVTTHIDIGLASDTRYWYRARALEDGGFSSFSNSDDAIIVGIPAAPTNIDVRPSGSTSISIDWESSSPSAQSFRIERSLDGGATWTTAGAAALEPSYFDDAQRTPEQEACYRVFAINAADQESPPSSTDCTIPPRAPTGLSATLLSDGTVDLRWTDASPSNTGYTVEALFSGYYCGYSPYCYYPYQSVYWAPIAYLAADAVTHHDPLLYYGQLTTYRVIATRDGGSSDPSNEATATAPPE